MQNSENLVNWNAHKARDKGQKMLLFILIKNYKMKLSKTLPEYLKFANLRQGYLVQLWKQAMLSSEEVGRLAYFIHKTQTLIHKNTHTHTPFILTGWKRIHNCEETPYITRMQIPFAISHTLTVLSNEDDAMYWLFDVKSKSENKPAYEVI